MKTKISNTPGQVGHQLKTRRLFRGAAFLTAIVASAISTVTMRAAPPWSPPVTLSAPAVNGHSPAVATTSDTGPMVATWVRQENSIYEVQASVCRKGTWGAPENLSLNGQGAFDVSVAMDRNGRATAVWTVGDTIQTSTNRFNSRRIGWTPPVALSNAGISVFDPHVIVDAYGNTTAMWVRYDMNSVPGIETAYRPVGGTWSAPQLLAAGAPGEMMLVASANGGDIAAIWNIGPSNAASIYASIKPFGGVWSTPYNVAPAAYRQGGGKIGIAANGDVTACWRTNTEIRVANKPAGGDWSAAITIYANRAISDYPTLAVMPSGDVMAAWITYVYVGGSYNYQIGSAVHPVGGAWSAPVVLTGSQEHDGELQARATNAGACVLTWVDVNSGQLKSSTWSTAGGWHDFTTIGAGSDTDLAVGGNTAVAIWMGGSYQAKVSTVLIQ